MALAARDQPALRAGDRLQNPLTIGIIRIVARPARDKLHLRAAILVVPGIGHLDRAAFLLGQQVSAGVIGERRDRAAAASRGVGADQLIGRIINVRGPRAVDTRILWLLNADRV